MRELDVGDNAVLLLRRKVNIAGQYVSLRITMAQTLISI